MDIKQKPQYRNHFKNLEKEIIIYGSIGIGTICSSSDSEQTILHDVYYVRNAESNDWKARVSHSGQFNLLAPEFGI